jgi:hypothetical protein
MSYCRSCKSEHILNVSAKHSGLVRVNDFSDPLPDALNLGSGDYLTFSYCGSCGVIQEGNWPIVMEEKTKCEECGSYNVAEDGEPFPYCLACRSMLHGYY